MQQLRLRNVSKRRHCLQDIKTANVLLGRNYVAKISDVRAFLHVLSCC